MWRSSRKKRAERKKNIKPYISRELIREIILMNINVRKPLKCMKIALDDNKIKP